MTKRRSGAAPGYRAERAQRVTPACRVEAPDRVLRMWTLLNTADDELHRVKLPPGAATRLERELCAVTTEVEQSVSPVLADELHHLIGQRQNVSSTLAELRVD
jgi:hypothetical protein